MDEVPHRSAVQTDKQLDGDPESDLEAGTQGTEADGQNDVGHRFLLRVCAVVDRSFVRWFGSSLKKGGLSQKDYAYNNI